MELFEKFLNQSLEKGQIIIKEYDRGKKESKANPSTIVKKLEKCYSIIQKDQKKRKYWLEVAQYNKDNAIEFINLAFKKVNNIIKTDLIEIEKISDKDKNKIYEQIISNKCSETIQKLFKLLFDQNDNLTHLTDQNSEEQQEKEQKQNQKQNNKKDNTEQYMKSSIGDFNLNDIFEERWRYYMSPYIINQDIKGFLKTNWNKLKKIWDQQEKPKNESQMVNILLAYANNGYTVFGDELFNKVEGKNGIEFIKSYFSNLFSFINDLMNFDSMSDIQNKKMKNADIDSEQLIKVIDSIEKITGDDGKTYNRINEWDLANQINLPLKKWEVKDEWYSYNLLKGLIQLYDVDDIDIDKDDEDVIKEKLKKAITNNDTNNKTNAEQKQKFENLNKHKSGKLIYYFEWFLTCLQHLDKVDNDIFNNIYENIKNSNSQLSKKIEEKFKTEEKSEEQKKEETEITQEEMAKKYFEAFLNKHLSIITDSFCTDLEKQYTKLNKIEISSRRLYKNFIKYVINGICDNDTNKIINLLSKTNIEQKFKNQEYINKFQQIMLSNDVIEKIISSDEFKKFATYFYKNTDNGITVKGI